MHPAYTEHKTVLLENAVLPPKLVEEHEIYHVDRRYFRGEAGMRMVEKVLNIDLGMNTRYRFGFQNNHARHDDNKNNQRNYSNHRNNDQQQNSSQGKRSYQDYSR